jgi:hypothetical protein
MLGASLLLATGFACSGKSAGSPSTAQLNGTYRIDERASQTNPSSPAVVLLIAFRSTCPASGCVASGIFLDRNNSNVEDRSDTGGRLVLKFAGGHWKSDPIGKADMCDIPGELSIHEVIYDLTPQPDGTLVGNRTVKFAADQCDKSSSASTDVYPLTVTRVGDNPPGLDIPDPASR